MSTLSSTSYTAHIFKICNLTKKTPNEFSSSLENAKSIYLDFESKKLILVKVIFVSILIDQIKNNANINR